MLCVQGLRRVIQEHEIFKDIDLVIEDGEIICISAPSGYGKTTILKCIAGLLEFEGSVILDGKSIHEYDMPDWRAEVLYVPQRPGLMSGTPMDFWNTTRRFKANAQRGFDDPIELGKKWNLTEHIWLQSWQEVSGGERQRLVLAMALSTRPRVLLLDEPTSALDAATTLLVEASLLEMKVSALWISHDATQIDRVATHHIMLT